jgi:hypothetical protein
MWLRSRTNISYIPLIYLVERMSQIYRLECTANRGVGGGCGQKTYLQIGDVCSEICLLYNRRSISRISYSNDCSNISDSIIIPGQLCDLKKRMSTLQSTVTNASQKDSSEVNRASNKSVRYSQDWYTATKNPSQRTVREEIGDGTQSYANSANQCPLVCDQEYMLHQLAQNLSNC